VRPLPPLAGLPVLDLFSRRSSLPKLQADGFEALGSHRAFVVQHEARHEDAAAAGSPGGGWWRGG
jgi:hypothetical protein